MDREGRGCANGLDHLTEPTMIIKRFVNQIHSGLLATRAPHPVNDEALFNPTPITEIGISVIMKSTPKHSAVAFAAAKLMERSSLAKVGRRHFLIVGRQTEKVRERSSENDEFVCPRPRY